MSIKTLSTAIALAAAAIAGLAAEANAGAACAPGAARYSAPRYSAPRASLTKVAAAKPAPIAPVAQSTVAPVPIAKVAAIPAVPGSRDGTVEEKVSAIVKPLPQQLAEAAPVDADTAPYTSVSAVAARLAALSTRRPALIVE